MTICHYKKIQYSLIFTFLLVFTGVLKVYGFDEGAQCTDCHDVSTATSVHESISCQDCHPSISKSTHPDQDEEIRKNITSSSVSTVCQQCHSFQKGIHRKMVTSSQSPACSTCHGSHKIKKAGQQTDNCLGCHAYKFNKILNDQTKQSLFVEQDKFNNSVHKELRCVDCHFGFSEKEHPQRDFENKRALTMMVSETCRRCHFDKYTQTLESIHYNMLKEGNDYAPVCVDCHGAHSIQSGRDEKLVSARRCETCHPDIYETYTASVHGDALLSEHIQDVPICSDCHSAHRIQDPRKIDFRNEIPQMCGNCHADEKLMKKYGLSTSVLQSYLEDFHGVTLTFYKKEDQPVRHIAVCVDCHGIHDISKTKGPQSTIVKARLLERCQKCHPQATENFPDSWISHYDPTMKRAPLVYFVGLFYKIFIPFMIIGLILQICLHVWRYAVNR